MATSTDNSGPITADQVHDAAAGAQAKVQDLAGKAQDQADALAGQAQNRIYEQVTQRSTQAGEQISQQASDLRAVSDALRDQGKEGPAETAARLADYAERTGSYLTDGTADSLLSDAEDFGRQRPAAVALGALALGFAASRFLKASSGRRYAQGSGRSTGSTPAPVNTPTGEGLNDPADVPDAEVVPELATLSASTIPAHTPSPAPEYGEEV